MPMQHKVNLSFADRMVYCCLICLCDLTDLNQFPFFSAFLKRCQNGCFLRYAHIAVISTVVIAGNRFKTVISVFRDQSCY